MVTVDKWSPDVQGVGAGSWAETQVSGVHAQVIVLPVAVWTEKWEGESVLEAQCLRCLESSVGREVLASEMCVQSVPRLSFILIVVLFHALIIAFLK